MNWYNSNVWWNAFSKYLEYVSFYTIGGEVIKEATGIYHTQKVAEHRNGFCLPTSMAGASSRYWWRSNSQGAIECLDDSGATENYENIGATMAAAW